MARARSTRRRRAVKPQPATTARRGMVLGGLALVALLAIAWLVWQRSDSQGPPTVDLGDTNTAVRQVVDSAMTMIELQPESAEAWAELAMVYHAHDFVEAALTAYREAESLAPEDARWPYLIAHLMQDEDAELALAELDRALALGTDFSGAYWNQGNLLLDLGRPDEALAAFQRAVELDPESSFAQAGLGRARLQRGEAAAAVEALTRAIEIDPEYADAHAFLAQAMVRLGQDETADHHAALAELYGGGPSVGPADPIFLEVVRRGVSVRWLSRRARGLQTEGSFAEAEALYRQALEDDPDNAEVLVGLGITLQSQSRLEEARLLYERALQSDAENIQALNNLGQLLNQMGDQAAAAQRFERALALDPLQIETRLNYGSMLLAQGDHQAAIDMARSVLDQVPAQIGALNIVGDAESAMGNSAAAAEAYQASTDLDPRQEQAWLNWAQTLADAGRHAEAVAVLRDAEAVLPGSVSVRALLAWELATAPEASGVRDGDAALAQAGVVVESMPEIVAGWDILGAAQAASGDFASAVESARKAIDMAREQGGTGAIEEIEDRLEGYRAGRAFYQTEDG